MALVSCIALPYTTRYTNFSRIETRIAILVFNAFSSNAIQCMKRIVSSLALVPCSFEYFHPLFDILATKKTIGNQNINKKTTQAHKLCI